MKKTAMISLLFEKLICFMSFTKTKILSGGSSNATLRVWKNVIYMLPCRKSGILISVKSIFYTAKEITGVLKYPTQFKWKRGVIQESCLLYTSRCV